jgi:hypothetical protein
MAMITKQQYVEYLLAIPINYINYTCTNLADHLDGVSHDAVVSGNLRSDANL